MWKSWAELILSCNTKIQRGWKISMIQQGPGISQSDIEFNFIKTCQVIDCIKWPFLAKIKNIGTSRHNVLNYFAWKIESPFSRYSALVIHIFWNVERLERIDPPIQQETLSKTPSKDQTEKYKKKLTCDRKARRSVWSYWQEGNTWDLWLNALRTREAW